MVISESWNRFPSDPVGRRHADTTCFVCGKPAWRTHEIGLSGWGVWDALVVAFVSTRTRFDENGFITIGACASHVEAVGNLPSTVSAWQRELSGFADKLLPLLNDEQRALWKAIDAERKLRVGGGW